MRFLIALILSLPILAQATVNDVDKAQLWSGNLLQNGGFESGKGSGLHKWTASAGTFNTTTSGSNLLDGKVSATWDSSSASQTLSYGALTIPNGLKGKNGVAVCKIMVPSGTATHTIQAYDGTNTLSSSTITSSTTPTYTFTNFIFPSSGTVTVRLVSVASDEPSITIDDCYLGDAAKVNITNVSQVQFIGSAYFAATTNCSWSTTSTSIAAFSTDTDCPGPTVDSNPGPGSIQTTDANLPQVTINNLPPGRYRVLVHGYSVQTTNGVTTFALTDGSVTINSGRGFGPFISNDAAQVVVEGIFDYSSAANRTFSIYASTSAGTLNLQNSAGNVQLSFQFYRYPTTTELAYRTDQVPFLWQGRHEQNCSWATTSTTYATPSGDGSCTFTEDYNINAGSVTSTTAGTLTLTPGIVFTPSKTGLFEICAKTIQNYSTSMIGGVQIRVGSTVRDELVAASNGSGQQTTYSPLCAYYNATSLASATVDLRIVSNNGANTFTLVGQSGFTPNQTIRWTIRDLSNTLATPQLTGNITSNTTGSLRHEAANINCDASSSITSQTGSWVSSVGNIASGACTVTLVTGAFSSAPYCTANNQQSGGIPVIVGVSVASATSITVDCRGDSGVDCSSNDFYLLCTGTR